MLSTRSRPRKGKCGWFFFFFFNPSMGFDGNRRETKMREKQNELLSCFSEFMLLFGIYDYIYMAMENLILYYFFTSNIHGMFGAQIQIFKATFLC